LSGEVYNKAMKRTILGAIIIMLFSLPLFAQIIDLRGIEFSFTSGPYTKWVSKYKGAVLWETNMTCSGTVKWGKTENYGRIVRTKEGFKHKVKLSPLEGGTTYHYLVISETKAGEIIESEDHTFTTPTPDIVIKSARFPSELRLGGSYDIKVVTELYDEPLDEPYDIEILRQAYDGPRSLGEILLGRAQVSPHPVRTNRTTKVRIQIKPLPGLKEAFQTKDVFIVRIKAQEKETNTDNNELKRTVPVTHG
jgi:hypothetical protein